MKVFIVLVAVCAVALGASIKQHRPAPRLDGRIVGGQATDIQDLPYQLALLSYGWQICGASIISANWALTAAHCVVGGSAEEFSLRAGSSLPEEGGTVHQAVEVIWHSQYDSWDIDYDFALIRVEEPFPIGQPGVQAVALPEAEPSEGDVCVASGWGRLSAGGSLPDSLQSVEVPIVSRAQCNELYGEQGYGISDRMICAGLLQGGRDSCQGDSGGPLVANEQQVGVVSWGLGCASPGFPGVYSNVANQRQWIRENSGV